MKEKLILGLIFGSGIGLCTGILTNNIAIGIVFGAGLGLFFGSIIKK